MPKPPPSATAPRRWRPITDLSEDDRVAGSEELPALAEVWRTERDRMGSDGTALAQFNERLRREWAIETGILERIYSLDRGTTQVLIEQGIDASLIPRDATDRPPELVAAIIKDQESAVEFLFDVVVGRHPLSASFIKQVHALMTRHQSTTTGQDQFGNEVEIPLDRGVFKDWPNNPTRSDGTTHEYCPPVQVVSEMERLLGLHEAHARGGVPPEVQAAWLHHRFTQIHPFQDGNGRIARALASLVFLQAGWFPLVVTRDHRTPYLDALEQADADNLRPLIDFFSARQQRAFVDALGIAHDVAREGARLDDQIAAVREMFARRDSEFQKELENSKSMARAAWGVAVTRLTDVARRLQDSMAPTRGENRRASVTEASDDDQVRKDWHRFEIRQAAKDLGYVAGSDFSCWVCMSLEADGSRSDVLLSLHQIGHEFRGVIGASMVFYRKLPSTDDRPPQLVDLQTVSEDIFQINYLDNEQAAIRRFEHWIDRGLIRALEAWRLSE